MLIEVSISPISEREMPLLQQAIRTQGLRPLWQHHIERQGVYFYEFRAELHAGESTPGDCFDALAVAIWRSIRRYVRLVMMSPELDSWPGGKEFSEQDYRRLMRSSYR